MIPNYAELELLAGDIHESRLRDANRARRIAVAKRSQPGPDRPPSIRTIIAAGHRVRWWFRSWATAQVAAAAPTTPVQAEELAPTVATETISASGASCAAEPYEALVIIARGSRQRHELLVSRRP